MLDFTALMEYVFENRLYESEVHGIEHWHQVEKNGLLLAPRTGADITVVRLFSIFHDCRRLDDNTTLNMARAGLNLQSFAANRKFLNWMTSVLKSYIRLANGILTSNLRAMRPLTLVSMLIAWIWGASASN